MTKQNKINKYNQSGFTLIEMIVVVSIAAILTSIAVPNFSAIIKSNRTTTATNELVSALLLARSEALKRSNTVSLCISDNQESCKGVDETNYKLGWIVFIDCNEDCVLNTALKSVDCDNDGLQNDTDQIIKVHGEVEAIDLTLVTTGGADPGYISYSFSGRSNVSRTFGVKPHDETTTVKEVIINRTGRVRTHTL